VRSRVPEPTKETLEKWKKCRHLMDGESTFLRVVINGNHLTHALVDSGAQCYAAINETLHRELNLPLIPIPDRMIGGPTSTTGGVMIQGVITNYYRMFIPCFSEIMALLTQLTGLSIGVKNNRMPLNWPKHCFSMLPSSLSDIPINPPSLRRTAQGFH
jgi:hypothetical protein